MGELAWGMVQFQVRKPNPLLSVIQRPSSCFVLKSQMGFIVFSLVLSVVIDKCCIAYRKRKKKQVQEGGAVHAKTEASEPKKVK
jgi:hypothetical protein